MLIMRHSTTLRALTIATTLTACVGGEASGEFNNSYAPDSAPVIEIVDLPQTIDSSIAIDSIIEVEEIKRIEEIEVSRPAPTTIYDYIEASQPDQLYPREEADMIREAAANRQVETTSTTEVEVFLEPEREVGDAQEPVENEEVSTISFNEVVPEETLVQPEFEPNSVIGSVSIPKIGVEHNLIAGRDDAAFDQGFALHTDLGVPGINSDKNILIGAHRQSLVNGERVMYDVTQLQPGDIITIIIENGATKTYEVSGGAFIEYATNVDLFNMITPDQDELAGVAPEDDIEQGFIYSCSYVDLGDLDYAASYPEGGWNKDWRIFLPIQEVVN